MRRTGGAGVAAPGGAEGRCDIGADLYIKSGHDAARAEHYPAFCAAAERRNRLQAHPGAAYGAAGDEQAYHEAQAEVERLYALLHAPEHYFRDAYNGSSLLAVLDLSWWRDVIPLLDEAGNLSPERAAGLRAELAQRAEVLEAKVARRAFPFDEDNWAEVADWQRERLRQLVDFLGRAVELGEPVNCSL